MGTARNGNVELVFDVLGTGPDLLLVCGTASTRAIWDLVRPQLAESFRTIAFDNRDSGESSIAQGPYAFADLVADSVAVLDAAGSSKAHIVGHSLGGVIAQELAIAHPERCTTLTLVCSWAHNDRYARNSLELMCALSENIAEDRILLASLLWVGAGPTTLGEIDLWQKTDLAMTIGPLAPREALVRQWKLALNVDTLERLFELKLPAHVIWGNEDRLLPPPLSRKLVEAIPGAVQTRIDACGHLPMVDRPEEFVDAVFHFLLMP